jgi:two-component system, cell cycle sensor histidine kinase and response regulator CckA
VGQPAGSSASTEEALALVDAILESTRDGILILGLDRRILRFNRQFVEMFRLPPEVVDRRDPDELARVVAEQLENPAEGLLKSPELWTSRPSVSLSPMYFRDGRVFERFTALHRVGDAALGRVIWHRDVSQPIRAAQALEQHRAFLEKAQEVAHIGSWVADLDGSGRLGWSSETHRIFGVPVSEFGGRLESFYAFVHEDDRADVRAAAEAATRGEKPYDVEHRIVTSGGVRWVHGKADVLRDAEGSAVRMIGTVQDITERRELEEQLHHAQKLEALGRLAGGIAHDLNNALTAIAGYSELTLNALPGDHPVRDDVDEIRRAAGRATSVTRQLLAFSRKQPLEPRVFDLNEVVGNLARLLERLLGPEIQLETVLFGGLPPIHADPGQIEQVIINLAVNARDAMPEGGRIALATSVEHIARGSGRGAAQIPPGAYVVLRVADTGHGMSREVQARVFEPFFTTKPAGKGTGLGLSMVWGTVKQSGGFIFLESEPGRGTTFRLCFPAAAAQDPGKPVDPSVAR